RASWWIRRRGTSWPGGSTRSKSVRSNVRGWRSEADDHAPRQAARMHALVDVARGHVDERHVGRGPVRRVEALAVRAERDPPPPIADAFDRTYLFTGGDVDDGDRAAATARHVEFALVA